MFSKPPSQPILALQTLHFASVCARTRAGTGFSILLATQLGLLSLSAATDHGGDEWLTGWESKASKAEFTKIEALESAPLSEGEKQYMAVEGTVEAGQGGSYGTVFRGYGKEAMPDAPTRFQFSFRPEVAGGSRYFIFDAEDSYPSTGPEATWNIDCVGGYWRLVPGATENGELPPPVITDISLTVGTVYSFVVEANPQTRKWSVTISDGTRSATFKDLHFRTAKSSLGKYLHFGFSSEASNSATGFGFSFGGIRVDSHHQ